MRPKALSPEELKQLIADAGTDRSVPRSSPELISQCAADITPEPISWLWPGRIAIGKQTLVAGEPGLGKSQALLAMAAAVTTGSAWPCDEGLAPLGNVVILQAEDGLADTVTPRLMAAGADRARVHIISGVKDPTTGRRAFNLQADLEMLEKKVDEVGDVRLVIIDPISAYLGPKVDSHVNAAVRGVLEPVGELASRLRFAIVCNTHFTKGSTGIKAMNRFIGSIAFVAAARAAFVVTKDAENESRMLFLPVKNNLAPLGKGLAFRLEQRLVAEGIVGSSIFWESDPVNMTADGALAANDAQGGGQRSALVEAEAFLRERLADGPVAAKEAEEHARALGITPRSLRRARKKVGVIAAKVGLKEGWMLRLPPEDAQVSPKAATIKGWPPSQNLAPFGGDLPTQTPHPDDGLDIPDWLLRERKLVHTPAHGYAPANPKR